jgi:hypothetical protein
VTDLDLDEPLRLVVRHRALNKDLNEIIFAPSVRQDDPRWVIGIATEGGKLGVHYLAGFLAEHGIGNRRIVDTSHLYLSSSEFYLSYWQAVQEINKSRQFTPNNIKWSYSAYQVVKIANLSLRAP